ncbi:MAG: hypothetical protein PWQ73_496 [Petrotoga sp.]|nr:hypothetical protein [Petrotoga sp.]
MGLSWRYDNSIMLPNGWSYEMKGQNIVFFLMGGERGEGALKHAKDRRNGKKGGNPKC